MTQQNNDHTTTQLQNITTAKQLNLKQQHKTNSPINGADKNTMAQQNTMTQDYTSSRHNLQRNNSTAQDSTKKQHNTIIITT